jgi:hypothetical protein
MNKHQIGDVDISTFLWRASQGSAGWTHFIVGIDRRVYAIEPKVRIQHQGPCEYSGCFWDFWVDSHGQGSGSVGWPPGTEHWRVVLSYRAPLITALSWACEGQSEDTITSPRLVSFAKSIATEVGLIYLDAHELRHCEIPWDEMTEEADLRLDWSEPNAFNLLFYEY